MDSIRNDSTSKFTIIKKEVNSDSIKMTNVQILDPSILYKKKNNMTNSSNDWIMPIALNGQAESYTDSCNSESTVQYKLEGRNIISESAYGYDSLEYGKIVVSITVDSLGNVIHSVAGAKGTTIVDRKLWEKSEEFAIKTKFNKSTGRLVTQKGTITYTFRRLK